MPLLSLPLHPLTFNGSCTAQPRVSSTFTVSASHTVTSEGSVFPRFVTDPFLTFSRRISSCPTTPLLVPASRILISLQRPSTLTRSRRGVPKEREARCSSCLQNSWFLRDLVGATQNLPRRRTFTRSDWLSSRCANRITDINRSHTPIFRSLPAGFHSLAFKTRRWDTMCFKGSARSNQRTPPLSDFPIRCGLSHKNAGTARWNRDQRLGML